MKDRRWWKNQFQLLFWWIQCFYFFNFYLLQSWSFNLWSWSPVLICIYSCSFQVGSCECTILFCSHVVERNCSKSQLVNCSWYCPGKLTFIFMNVDEEILNTPSNRIIITDIICMHILTSKVGWLLSVHYLMIISWKSCFQKISFS